MRRLAVGEIMTRDLIKVKPSTNLSDCAKTCVKKRVNTLLVTEKKRLLGILTSRDILWALTKAPKDLKKIKAADIAKRKVAVTKPSADVSQVLQKMQALNFRRLPVISRGELLGVVTLKDILHFAPELQEHIGNLADIKEEERKTQEASSDWLQEGLCEECGAFSELLKVEGQLLCPDCRDELH